MYEVHGNMKPLWKVRRLWRGVVRVIQWAPVIWQDEDWDYIYILRLLDYKLKRMHPVILGGFACNAQKVALEIEQARLLIANIQEDPDDEWSLWYDQHPLDRDVNHPPSLAKIRALELSAKREKVNWHKLWKHLDKHMKGWWD